MDVGLHLLLVIDHVLIQADFSTEVAACIIRPFMAMTHFLIMYVVVFLVHKKTFHIRYGIIFGDVRGFFGHMHGFLYSIFLVM